MQEGAQWPPCPLRQVKIQGPCQSRVNQEQQGGHDHGPARAFVRIEYAAHVVGAQLVERRLPMGQGDHALADGAGEDLFEQCAGLFASERGTAFDDVPEMGM